MASTAAAAARLEASIRTRPRSAMRPRGNPLRSGVAWIVVVATLLAGVVALNVAVLQLNVRLDELGRERAQLRADNAALQSQLSTAGTSSRIESLARKRLGLSFAAPEHTSYVELGK